MFTLLMNKKDRSISVLWLCLIGIASVLPAFAVQPLHQNGIVIGNFRYRLFDLSESEAAAAGLPMHYAELYNYDFAGKYNCEWMDYSNYWSNDPDNRTVVFPSHVSYNGNSYTVVGVDAWRYPTGQVRNSYCSTPQFESDTMWLKLIKEIVLPDSLLYISSPYSFSSLKNLETVILPPTLKSIADGSFSSNMKLKKVDLPLSLETINASVFSNCGIESIYIPRNVRSVDRSAFKGNILREIAVDPENPYLDSRDNCNGILETASNTLVIASAFTIIPESTEHLGEYVFDRIQFENASLSLPLSIQSIGQGCFCRSNLESITNFDQLSLKSIEDRVFMRTELRHISLPPTITSVKYLAFASCQNLESLKLGKNVVEFDKSALDNTPSLMSLSVEEGNPKYDSRENCNAIIQTSNNKLIRGCKSSKIPATVKYIGDSAFCNVAGFELESMPKVSQIGYRAFVGSKVPNVIHVNRSLRVIDRQAFMNCKNLEKVVFDYRENRTLGKSIFSGTDLKTIILAVDVLKHDVIGYCKSLHTVVLDQAVDIDDYDENENEYSAFNQSRDFIKRIVFDNISGKTSDEVFITDFGLDLYYHSNLIITPEPNWVRTQWMKSRYSRLLTVVGRGDINQDDSVDGEDLNMLINMILTKGGGTVDFSNNAEMIADINYDDQIDGSDLNALINILLGK